MEGSALMPNMPPILKSLKEGAVMLIGALLMLLILFCLQQAGPAAGSSHSQPLDHIIADNLG